MSDDRQQELRQAMKDFERTLQLAIRELESRTGLPVSAVRVNIVENTWAEDVGRQFTFLSAGVDFTM